MTPQQLPQTWSAGPGPSCLHAGLQMVWGMTWSLATPESWVASLASGEAEALSQTCSAGGGASIPGGCKPCSGVPHAGLQMVWGTGLSLTVSEGWLDFERPESDLRGSRGMTVVGSMMMFMSFCNCRNMVSPHKP